MRLTVLCTFVALVAPIGCAPSPTQAKELPVIEYAIAELDTRKLSGVQVLPLFKPDARASIAVKLPLEQAHVKTALLGLGAADDTVVSFQLSDEDATKFADFTGKHVNEVLAFVLDHRVVSYALIAERLPGQAQLSGRFTTDEAKSLLAKLQ